MTKRLALPAPARRRRTRAPDPPVPVRPHPAARALTLVCGIAVGMQCALLARSLVRLGAPSADVSATSAATAAPPGAAVHEQLLRSAHLFGTPDLRSPGVVTSGSADVTLAGTIAFGRPEDGLALLAVGSESMRVHRAGSRLPDGARLAGVWADHVTLAYGDGVRVVALPHFASGSAVPVAADTTPEGMYALASPRTALAARARERAALAVAMPAVSTDAVADSPAARRAYLLAERIRARGARIARGD